MKKIQQRIALILIFTLSANAAFAGITITRGTGITVTAADGILFIDNDGISVTAADSLAIAAADGVRLVPTNGITVTAADEASSFAQADDVHSTRADGITVTAADGITVTAADGITVTAADNSIHQVETIIITKPDGITVTAADGITVTAADGITRDSPNGVTVTAADGIVITNADGITVTAADEIIGVDTNGARFIVAPDSVTFTNVDGITVTAADGARLTGADGITVTAADGITVTAADATHHTGLQSLDPELAAHLNRLTDDSGVNAVVIYHRLPNASDIEDLMRLGVGGGTRYTRLPMIMLSATRDQIIRISQFPAVRSIYGNRTLQTTINRSKTVIGVDRVRADDELTFKNFNTPLSGSGVTVAVLDTGIDATHPDLAGHVVQNVKLTDTQSVPNGFMPPAPIENLANTDQLYGHGTFVAGIIASSGARSNGKFGGVAPGANIVGLSAGDLNLTHVLAGFDYLLERAVQYNVRVVNCSFSANTVFDTHDPVNIATRLLTDANINVVFSAGNAGDGWQTLNPYSIAPWVVSVGATDERGRVAQFSSRGAFGSTAFAPTLVAPGTSITSLRSSTAPSLTGVFGIESGQDIARLTSDELPFYTTASGTSFSAPQVAGTIALMLEANGQLTTRQIKNILRRAASPIPTALRHEAGAGMLNAHAATLEAAFRVRRAGLFRATLNQGQVRFSIDAPRVFDGIAHSNQVFSGTLDLPENTFRAAVQIAWGDITSLSDLSLTLDDPRGVQAARANTLGAPGLTGKRERVVVSNPLPGTWGVRVAHTANASSSIEVAQPFTGILELARVTYPGLADLAALPVTQQEEARQVLRSFVMLPVGENFRPESAPTRAELAAALARGGFAPQYLPAASRYTDVRDRLTSTFVESVQNAPDGAFFIDVNTNQTFRPHETVSRLTAAVALVRAAGLRLEAEGRSEVGLPALDIKFVPSSLRGYVAVALERGLLTTRDGFFFPKQSLTRIELAHALARLNDPSIIEPPLRLPNNRGAFRFRKRR